MTLIRPPMVPCPHMPLQIPLSGRCISMGISAMPINLKMAPPTVQPFPNVCNRLGTMASSDFSRQALLRNYEYFIAFVTSVRPPCPHHFYFTGFRTFIGLQLVWQSFILLHKPEMVSARWCRSLPAPSFSPLKPHGENLGVRLYPSHCRADLGLSPIRTCARQAHRKSP